MLADMEDFFTYLIVSVITISCVRNIYGFLLYRLGAAEGRDLRYG